MKELTRDPLESELSTIAKNAHLQNEGSRPSDFFLQQRTHLHQIAAKQVVLYQKTDDAPTSVVHSTDPTKLQDLIDVVTALAQVGSQL